ncbi:hypothetical protein TNCV_281631 [Trichonephila clavipes]|nr:hypothetical protein TNCV_281631 [Trichonephila clavipes]
MKTSHKFSFMYPKRKLDEAGASEINRLYPDFLVSSVDVLQLTNQNILCSLRHREMQRLSRKEKERRKRMKTLPTASSHG